MGTSQSHTRRGEICHRSRERPFEWKRRLIQRWRGAGSSSRIYTPPSAVLSPVALEPLSFFLPSLFRFYVFSTWLQSELDYVHVMGRILVLWWSKTGTRYWALQNLISRFASFYFETDVFTLYLISNQNDFFHFFIPSSRIPSIFKRGWGRFNKINIEAIEQWMLRTILDPEYQRQESVWTQRCAIKFLNLFYAPHLKEEYNTRANYFLKTIEYTALLF